MPEINLSYIETLYLELYSLTTEEWLEIIKILTPYLSNLNYSLELEMAYQSIHPDGDKVQTVIKKLMETLLMMQLGHDLGLPVMRNREEVHILEHLKTEILRTKEV